MNFEILKAELALSNYSAMTDTEVATDLNNVVVAIKQPISTHDCNVAV